jgi:hypothetical protein
MIVAQGGIFGWVGHSTDVIAALAGAAGLPPAGTSSPIID